MAYSIIIREKAVNLRKKGYSLNEIHEASGASKSILSEWLRDTVLSDKAKARLLTKIKLGQFNSAVKSHQKTKKQLDDYLETASKDFDHLPKIDQNLSRFLCSLIYWCEGGKNHYSGVNFTNSDPKLVRTFLKLFREGFEIDEKKFRVCIHLHAYHIPDKQRVFWSKITGIPERQFIKPYMKPNTGKRLRENYQGCVAIRYGDVKLARDLLMHARAFFDRFDFEIT